MQLYETLTRGLSVPYGRVGPFADAAGRCLPHAWDCAAGAPLPLWDTATGAFNYHYGDCAYSAVPEEMRAYPQWALWRGGAADRDDIANPDDPRVSKAPHGADGYPVSLHASNLMTYWQAVAAAAALSAQTGIAWGIGFIFRESDPFGVIDVDFKVKSSDLVSPEAWAHWCQQAAQSRTYWYNNCGTYSEISQGGAGFHAIYRVGDLKLTGNRFRNVEIYVKDRFITFTGARISANPALAGPDQMWADVAEWAGATETELAPLEEVEATLTDAEVYERAVSAFNGDKFLELWNTNHSDWNKDYDRSSVDARLMQMLVFHTESNDQAMRLFSASGPGQRAKWQRRLDYRMRTLAQARRKAYGDRAAAALNDSWIEAMCETTIARQNSEKATEVAAAAVAVREELLAAFPQPTPAAPPQAAYTPMPAQVPQPVPQTQPAPYTDVVSDGGMDPRDRPVTPTSSTALGFELVSSMVSEVEPSNQPATVVQEPVSSVRAPEARPIAPPGPVVQAPANGLPAPEARLAPDGQPDPVNATAEIDMEMFEPEENCEDLPDTLAEMMRFKSTRIKRPAGLLGELSRYIFESSHKPVAVYSLVSAIGLMAGICGRAYNVRGTGVNLYLLALGGTGTGKDNINAGMGRVTGLLMEKHFTDADRFIGPSDIRSDAGLLSSLSVAPSFVSVIGEFGIEFKKFTDPRHNDHGVKKVMLDMHGKSGRGMQLGSTARSDSTKNIKLKSGSAFSVVGEGVPETFYESLTPEVVSDGLLPRFVPFEYKGGRVPTNYQKNEAQIDPDALRYLSDLVQYVIRTEVSGQVIDVKFSARAELAYRKFDKLLDDHVNQSDEFHKQLFNRVAMNADRLAAIVAIGLNAAEPIVTLPIYKWALRAVLISIAGIVSRFESGEVGSNREQIEQRQHIVKLIGKYITTPFMNLSKTDRDRSIESAHRDGVVLSRLLRASANNKTFFRTDKAGGTDGALTRTLKGLIEDGALTKLDKLLVKERYGTSADAYRVDDPKYFTREIKKPSP